MSLPKGTTKVAREVARAIIRRRWQELLPLLADGLRSRVTVESLEAEFGWKTLGPRIRQMHIALTGEPEEMVPFFGSPEAI
jgi:hypothetical protein